MQVLNIHYADVIIIVLYLILVVIVGLLASKMTKWCFAKKRQDETSQIDSYFLGGRDLPWYFLAASGKQCFCHFYMFSGMSSNLDLSGTMINTAMVYSMGIKGSWIEMRGGLSLAVPFMLFIGKWLRRSECVTASEWMTLRFGRHAQGHFARICTAFVVLIMGMGSITYFAVGAGKFVSEFVNIPPFLGIKSEFWASLIMIVLSMIYTVAVRIFIIF